MAARLRLKCSLTYCKKMYLCIAFRYKKRRKNNESLWFCECKEMGYSIKLDTNGCNPKILKELLDENLLDYVAMDIKNEVETCKYSKTCGLAQMRVDNILESINILKNSKIDYEFRTTITKELHDIDSIRHILAVIGNQPKYFLQNFRLSENVLDKNMHGFSIEELRNLEHTLNVDYKNVKVRDLYEEKGEEAYV